MKKQWTGVEAAEVGRMLMQIHEDIMPVELLRVQTLGSGVTYKLMFQALYIDCLHARVIHLFC